MKDIYMTYDICYEISRYLFPIEYSHINSIFHIIALKDVNYMRIVGLKQLYENDKIDKFLESSRLHELIRWLYNDLITISNTSRIIEQDRSLSHWFVRAIRERKINLVRFMKDNIKWKYSLYNLEYGINIDMLYTQDKSFISNVGITLYDIKYMPCKFIIDNIDLIMKHIACSKHEILDAIYEEYSSNRYIFVSKSDIDRILWMLMDNGYNIGQTHITFKDLIKANKEHYVKYIHDESWIVSHCKLDTILKCYDKNNYDILDIIKNRNYPVFETLYIKSNADKYSPFELLCMSVQNHNTEAFKVLTNIYPYNKEEFKLLLDKYNVIKKRYKTNYQE